MKTGQVTLYHKYIRIVAEVQRLATIRLNLTLQYGDNETNPQKILYN